MTRLGLASAWLAALTAGCTTLPWGAGGLEVVAPGREIPAGISRQLDPDGLGRASERLALAVGARWDKATLPLETVIAGAVHVSWGGLQLDLGELELALAAGGLEARVQLAAEPATLTIASPTGGSCALALALGPGTWVAPLELGADPLGRIRATLGAGAHYDGTLVASASCLPQSALLALLPDALSDALTTALGEALSDEAASALGLDLALSWSTAVAADALGTGFLRVSVRAREGALVEVDADRLLVSFAVGFEAEPHPCMAPLALPAPDVGDETPVPRSDRNGGALALRLEALEQALQAAWVAGVACADHLSGEAPPVTAEELAAAWPELGRYAADARVRLELWPEELPTLRPGDDGGVRVTTGRVTAEVWVEDGGAWWRAATVAVSLAVDGELSATPDGFLWLDPSAVEAWPAEVDDGLLAAPDSQAIGLVLAPLVEGLVTGRPILRLPPSARPAQTRALEIGAGHALLTP